jgi:hypothetical protein
LGIVGAGQAATLDKDSLMNEEWRPIPDYPYEVSSLGRVRRTGAGAGAVVGRILRPVLRNGYHAVTLRWTQPSVHRYIHRLLAEAFHGAPASEAIEAAHRDGQKTNNCVDNIYWATPLQNAADKHRHGTTARGERIGNSRLTEDQVRIIRSFGMENSVRKTARAFGLSSSQVHRIKHRSTWRHIQWGP